MIFLGAGASKIFGLKTLQDLTDDIIIQMKEKGCEETILTIISALKHFGITPDFENVYATLEAISDPTEGFKKSGGLAAYVAHKTNFKFDNDTSKCERLKTLLNDFRSLIYKECTIKKGMIEKKRTVFDQLFKTCREWREGRTLPSITGIPSAQPVVVPIDYTIVTTNYDMAVELYHGCAGLELTDGFKKTNNNYMKELDFFEFGHNERTPWLIRLHGSIWQFRQEEKVIKTTLDPKDAPLEISVGEQMMIYPVGEKPILQHPYFGFYYLFKEQPWENLIVIGYSFRDEPINLAIIERLKTLSGPRCKLIVVNPHADEIVKNLGPLEPELENKIIRINGYFGEDETLFEKISRALSSKNMQNFQAREHALGKI